MKITYTGPADRRIIDSSDFPNRDDDFHYEWTPGSWTEVDDETAKWLLEYSRHEFVQYEDPKNRDQRTKAELLEEADRLDIPGRSSMKKEELRDAIYERRAEGTGDASARGETETPSETLQEAPEITESREAVIAQNDLPTRTESDTE